jgi:hypothetical protein
MMIIGNCTEESIICLEVTRPELISSSSLDVQTWNEGASGISTANRTIGFTATDGDGFPAHASAPDSIKVKDIAAALDFELTQDEFGQVIYDGYLVLPPGLTMPLAMRVNGNTINGGYFYLSDDSTVANMTLRAGWNNTNAFQSFGFNPTYDNTTYNFYRFRYYITEENGGDFSSMYMQYNNAGAGFKVVPGNWLHPSTSALPPINTIVDRQGIEVNGTQFELDGSALVAEVYETVTIVDC